MLGEFAVSVILSPVGAMLISAAASGGMGVKLLRTNAATKPGNSLAALFDRDTLQGQLSDPKLRHIRARGLRRSSHGHRRVGAKHDERMLHDVAAVIRGSERNPDLVRAAKQYLEGEGFVIVGRSPEPIRTETGNDVAMMGDFEEVKLLPPPSSAQAA